MRKGQMERLAEKGRCERSSAGFILFQIRRIPKLEQAIAYENLRLTITKMAGPKIERVRVERV